MKVASLWEKNSWWAKFLKNWLKKKMRLAPWDVEYFVNNSTKMSFGKLIHNMYDPNPKA
jgi:hypothetical protein